MVLISGWRAGKRCIFIWFEVCKTRVYSCTIIFTNKERGRREGRDGEGRGGGGWEEAIVICKEGWEMCYYFTGYIASIQQYRDPVTNEKEGMVLVISKQLISKQLSLCFREEKTQAEKGRHKSWWR